MKNELKEIIQEKCRKFVKYNSFDFNEFENNVLEIFEKVKENEYYDSEYNYEIKYFIDKTLISEYGRYNDLSKLSKELKNIENSTIEFKSKADSALELKNGNDIFATTVDKWTDDTNPLLDSYMFKVKEIEEIDNTVKEVNNLPFTKDKINNINYGEDIVHQMIVVFNVVRKICIVAVAALVLVTAFLIANTIKLAIYSRRREIEIMRLVGASNTSIKVPFILEGLFIGIIGSIIPILVTIFGYSTLYDFFGGKLFGSALAALIAPMPFVYNISGILVLIGILVGMIGSYQAVRKYLKI